MPPLNILSVLYILYYIITAGKCVKIYMNFWSFLLTITGYYAWVRFALQSGGLFFYSVFSYHLPAYKEFLRIL